jgi:apolipoprotein N-acyltransferase
VAEQAERLGVPFSVGMIEDVVGDPDERVINSQVIVTPTGEITSRYDKVRLVPFGEYVPLRGLLESLDAPIDEVPTNAVTGDLPAVLALPDGERAATVISWEVFFGGRSREGVKQDAGFITNPTNGASYHGTIVQTQQVASSRLRALESGRWVVQADIDAGDRPGLTSEESAEIRRLKAENRRLREDNEILRKASIFFAGELDPRNR